MAKKEKPAVEKKDKNWDKKEYLKLKLSQRPRSFYILTADSFLKVSTALAICSLFMSLFIMYKVHSFPNHASYYINSVNGKIYNNNITPEKYEKMVKAMQAYRAKQAQQQSKNN